MEPSNYSLNSKAIKQAATQLINDNASNLIEYIYREAEILTKEDWEEVQESKEEEVNVEIKEEATTTTTTKAKGEVKATTEGKEIKEEIKIPSKKSSVFKNTEVRIGLCIRILAKTNRYFDENLINLILDDIDVLRKESDYLLSFKDPKARKAALDEEYALVQGYVDMDDTISLNQDPETVSRLSKASKVGRMATDGQCIIQ